jgi:hypothetical protein
MKLTIDKRDKDALQKACILHSHEVQFHETDEPEILHAYVSGTTENSAFWLGVTFNVEKSIYDTKLEWTDGGIYKFGGQDKFKRDEN